MYLEGVDVRLYNLETDPLEQTDRADDPDCADIRAELEAILFRNWDPEALRATIALDQQRRLRVHKSTGGDPTYVNLVRHDDGARYIRNAGAADTKAKSRLPYVEPAAADRT